jgi:hypothetical protein|tara:strand:- start:158 stop:394 length:237 start_codon:yes stop_codon:yes gene_type:complete
MAELSGGCRNRLKLKAPIFNHGIGKQAITEQFQLLACFRFIISLELKINNLSDPQFADAFHPKAIGSRSSSLPSRVKH